LGTASVLALLASSSITPANAQASTATAGIYTGGSTLASEAFRQIFDCYMGANVGFGTAYPDGFAFDPSFPAPGKLPTTCTLTSLPIQGMYAGVGSGVLIEMLADGFGVTVPLYHCCGSLVMKPRTPLPLPTPAY
ncbi:MAG: hypothetical protein ACK463_40265, partial [Bradyrhizobium sp.]